jgi:hypothetical protein
VRLEELVQLDILGHKEYLEPHLLLVRLEELVQLDILGHKEYLEPHL